MSVLDELIVRYRGDELTFDEFVETAASMWVPRPPTNGYDFEEDRGAYLFGVSHVTMQTAINNGTLTPVEAEAIMSAIPATVP